MNYIESIYKYCKMADILEQARNFVAHMLAGRETVPESMTADTLRKVAAFAAEQAERIV